MLVCQKQPEPPVAPPAASPAGPTNQGQGSITYLPAVDGLRAVAILGVLFFHLKIPGFSLGWAGVWLFYVISGFLITSILLRAKDRPHYFKNFYARRSLRIFPIYYLVFLAILALASLTGKPVYDFPYFVFYAQNYLLGADSFQVGFPVSFGHTWSLAVEEQFYFFWPLAIFVLRKPSLFWFSIILFCAAPLARFLILTQSGNPYLMVTPLLCDTDALSVGAVIAILRSSAHSGQFPGLRKFTPGLLQRALWVLLALCCLATLFIGVRYGTKVFSHVALATVLSVLFGALLGQVLLGSRRMNVILSSAPMVHIGRISYGIYLYHGPVFVYMESVLNRTFPSLEQNPVSAALIRLGITYLAAAVSFKFLEQPLLRLKTRFQ